MTVFFDQSLVLADAEFESRDEVIRALADLLVGKGLVKPSFADAVLKREARFPTGLPTAPFAVAIPHTDPEHCIRPCLAVARLSKPVEFGIMGDLSATLDVSIVFLLGLLNGADHVSFLCRLTEMFQKPDCLTEIMRANVDALVSIVKSNAVI